MMVRTSGALPQVKWPILEGKIHYLAWVTTLQSLLNTNYTNHGFSNTPFNFSPPLMTDGTFGPMTIAAVKDYQSAKGLGVDGIVGPKTWHALGVC